MDVSAPHLQKKHSSRPVLVLKVLGLKNAVANDSPTGDRLDRGFVKLKDKKIAYQKLGAEIRDAEEALKTKTLIPARKKLVGTYWKYKNCYSCPREEKDYWMIQRHITSMSINCGTLMVKDVQIDCYGKAEVEIKPIYLSTGFPDYGLSGWNPSDEKSFKRTISKIKRLLK